MWRKHGGCRSSLKAAAHSGGATGMLYFACMERLVYLFILFGLLFLPLNVQSEMTGGDFSIPVDTFSISDNGTSTGGNFTLRETGEFGDTGSSTGGALTLNPGFQAAISGAVSLTLSGATVSLGTLSLDAVSTASTNARIITDSLTGYTLTLTEDGNLRTSGGLTIPDVSGTVTAGTPGYGISTTGGDGLLTSDTAIDGTVTVASKSTPSSATTTINFKAAIGTSSKAGSYSHTVTLSITANP